MIDLVRAWKDSEYRKTLSAEELASLPESPTGLVPAADEELKAAVGGLRVNLDVTLGGPTRCKTEYPECCYNSTIGPLLKARF
jgi:mersacidin/lichenicidin family type 2 lantibiotic